MEHDGVPFFELVTGASKPVRQRAGRRPNAPAGDIDARSLRHAVDASAEAIFVTDPDGIITFVNPQFTRLYGYTPEEVVGRATPRILKSGTLSPDWYGEFWRALLDRGVVQLSVINRTKDGRLVAIDGTASAIIEDGRLAGFFSVQRDATERRLLDEKLGMAQFALDRAGDAVLWFKGEMQIFYANDAAAELVGYSRDELCTMAISEIESDAPSSGTSDRWRHGVGLPPIEFESRIRHKDGTVLPVEVTVNRLCFGTLDFCSAAIRNVAERRRSEDQLRQAQKMEAIGRLAGGIAHDFNNLLTAILGYSQLLHDRVRDQPELAGDIEEIRRAGERASGLTRQLLAYSRKQVLSAQVLDVNATIVDLAKLLRRVIGENIELAVVPGKSIGLVKADPGQIEQVLMNLAINARDAMAGTGGLLKIETANVTLDHDWVSAHPGSVQGRYVSLAVSDSGCGIPPELLPHIFEPFFTTKEADKGTGLGLATVYGIVKQSGGYISVSSTPGQSTTFTVFLPEIQGSGPMTQPGQEATTPVAGTETILLVEDEVGIRLLVRRVLETHGYTVLEAEDVKHALSLAEHYPGDIDLLLTDVVMPGQNGPALAQHILGYRSEMRVLYVSGFPLAVDVDRLSRRASFLQKPFTPTAVAQHVRACLDGVGRR